MTCADLSKSPAERSQSIADTIVQWTHRRVARISPGTKALFYTCAHRPRWSFSAPCDVHQAEVAVRQADLRAHSGDLNAISYERLPKTGGRPCSSRPQMSSSCW